MTKKMKTDAFLNDPSWYKDAVIYQVHVKSYFDANNDGVGDFTGLIEKLDYIASLGVNAIWLLPFYPSPMRDDGYDIADYRGVHPAYGTMADARRFIAEAHRRGLRVITEMVINHTSDQHAWFQKSRLAKKNSKARNVYVWSDTNKKYEGTRIIFSDTESSNWTWDSVAGQYFWHRFYSNQPDLNFDNPEVLKEVLRIMHFWFDIGVDGLRLDAIPYLMEREGTSNENLPETHQVLKAIRADLNANYPDRMLLAEANLWPEDIQQYFGSGDECHMAFHFPLMPRMYMAIAQEDRFPIIDILRQMPEIPQNCQWAIFLRNHDELTLEMVTDQERDYLWNFYAADKRARINLGIRRRLAPLVERDRRRIELLNSLLLSMPGTPTLYYGDEIGMGDNIFLGDRHGVRTPMQWSDDRNGGFSRADPASLIAPTLMDPLYGFQAINVEAQTHDTHSLLNWTRRMLAVRKQQKAFGRGNLKMLAPANRRILAYTREYTSPEGLSEIILCVANMSRAAQAAELDLSSYNGKIPVEMIGGSRFPLISKLNYLLTLPPYGFYWFLLADESQMPSWYIAPLEKMPELTTVIIKQDLQDLLQPPARTLLEKESLPAYLAKCPWFCHSAEAGLAVNLCSAITVGDASELMVLAEIQVHRGENTERYSLPLGVVAEHLAGTSALQWALAHLRQKRTVGLLTDALTLPGFCRRILSNLHQQLVQPLADGELQFIASPLLQEIAEKAGETIDLVASKDINGSVVIDESMLLKPIRKISAGIHPEIEINNYLSEAGFNNIAPLLGEVRRVDAQAEHYTLMILQGYINNQGDAWQWTQNTLERAFRDRLSAGTSSMDMQYPAMAELEQGAETLGTRLGEMHSLLAQATDNPRFGYLTISAKEAAASARSMGENLQKALDILAHHQASGGSWLISHRIKIIKLIKHLAAGSAGSIAIRIHGNLHLGQVLIARSDAYFVNFSDAADIASGALGLQSTAAKPRGLQQKKITGKDSLPCGDLKHSPLKDVADMLCSFADAAATAMRSAQNTAVPFQLDHIRDMASSYSHQVHRAFFQAYSRATQDLPHQWQQPKSVTDTLALLQMAKRIQEIINASHKPDWLEVPAQGLFEIVKPLLETHVDP